MKSTEENFDEITELSSSPVSIEKSKLIKDMIFWN